MRYSSASVRRINYEAIYFKTGPSVRPSGISNRMVVNILDYYTIIVNFC